MNSIFRNTLVKPGAVLALAMAGILGGGAAHAAGTASNTLITNTASLAYKVGGTDQNAIVSSPTGSTNGTGAPTSFVVDNKVNLTVTTSDVSPGVPVIPGQTIALATPTQVATFVVTNTGNTVQDFALTSLFNYTGATANVLGGTVTDTFDPSACLIKIGTAVSPTYAGATTGTFIDELAADAARTIYVVCAIPLAQIDGDIAAISLTASVLKGGLAGTQGSAYSTAELNATNTDAGIEIVFADTAGTDDIARDGKSSARDAFQVKSAKLTVTKTMAPVCDPFNGNTNPKNIPGSYVSYTITIANSGTTSAILGIVSDGLTSTLTFDPDLIQGLTAATCNAVGASPTPGVATNASGNVKVVARSATSYKTSGTADTDGVVLAVVLGVPTLSVDFGTVLPVVGSTYTAGELKPTEAVTVTFQAKIN